MQNDAFVLFFDASQNIQRDLEKYKTQDQTSRQINFPEDEMFIQQSFGQLLEKMRLREHRTPQRKPIMGKWN